MDSKSTNSTQPTRSGAFRVVAGPLIVSAVTLVAVLATLDPADCRPGLPPGPGTTLDESFNVQMGVYLAESVKVYGLAILDPQSVEEIFGTPNYNPDHPPLGRIWLGVFHGISQSVAPVDDVDGQFITVHARAGSAFAFALTVLLVGMFSGIRWGRLAGITSSVSIAVMPRLFGHAHLASLETVMGLAWTVAILGTIQLWTRLPSRSNQTAGQSSTPGGWSEPPRDIMAALCGLLIGLALLTKMQAIVLPPLISVWALWHWRWRAVRPLLIANVSVVVVFVAGWPWLWLDLPGHLAEYFGRTTGRVSLKVWYLGRSISDVDVPWHYPWVMACVTVPIGVLLLAAAGLWRTRRGAFSDPVTTLILGSVVAPLVLFSLPGVAVYDGARLFLVAFPGIAILAGSGIVSVQDWLTSRGRASGPVISLILTMQLVGVVTTCPYSLSYYNALVGGLTGADRLGFEVTYWGDSVSRDFLESLTRATPEGAVVQVAPVLHQFQIGEIVRQAPMLRRSHVRLESYDPDRKLRSEVANQLNGSDEAVEFLAVFHRRADAPSAESLEQDGWTRISSESCLGVAVSSIWRRSVEPIEQP